MNTTITPADEQAAASDKIAVTCLHITISPNNISMYENQDPKFQKRLFT